MKHVPAAEQFHKGSFVNEWKLRVNIDEIEIKEMFLDVKRR